MNDSRLKQALRKRRLVCDGAMGTQLMLAGLEPGACGERWNLTHPERVLAIQCRYAEAGADCIITNTFGGNRLTLSRHHQAEDLVEINHAAARIARQAFGGKEGYVLGDIGPVGGMLEPCGDLKAEDVGAALAEQARALVEGGVDAIILETQTSLEELGLGIQGAKAAGAPFLIASLAYDRSMDGKFFKTMMGISPEQAAQFAQEQGADAVALNCGTGVDMEAAAKILRLYRSSSDLLTMAQPNAGQPVLENLKAVYKQTPQQMAKRVPEVLEAGANIIGSCCGSTPEHTRAIRAMVDRFNAGAKASP
jgi:5-methyltetrahydrofolate--homocysteine methyltransferase